MIPLLPKENLHNDHAKNTHGGDYLTTMLKLSVKLLDSFIPLHWLLIMNQNRLNLEKTQYDKLTNILITRC